MVYNTLPTMVRHKLVRTTRRTRARQHADPIYEITAKGLQSLRKNLREAVEAPLPLRDPLLLWIDTPTSRICRLLPVRSAGGRLKPVGHLKRRKSNIRPNRVWVVSVLLMAPTWPAANERLC